MRADASMFKAFWPEVRGNYFFRSRRLYMDFLKSGEGKIYYLPNDSLSIPPFILVGNWRGRTDITALWYVKGMGAMKKSLVLEAARESFNDGAERMITKLLNEYEAAEFRQWGFEKASRIVLLEKRLFAEPPAPKEAVGVKIFNFRKSMLGDVLKVDASSFNDFWKLDDRTLEAIAASCIRNVFLVARRPDEVLGYGIGGSNGRLGYLQRLGVDAPYQGQGIGHLLASTMLRALYRMGARVVMVNTQEENEVAITLYQKLGFEELADTRYILQYAAADRERGS